MTYGSRISFINHMARSTQLGLLNLPLKNFERIITSKTNIKVLSALPKTITNIVNVPIWDRPRFCPSPRLWSPLHLPYRLSPTSELQVRSISAPSSSEIDSPCSRPQGAIKEHTNLVETYVRTGQLIQWKNMIEKTSFFQCHWLDNKLKKKNHAMARTSWYTGPTR